ncbi:MAG TPA: hypothetical protein VEJ18_20000, partial [Planctomycetota bacterium]|nr:hypothetical protein [Planctomycetota bacterium]
MRSGHLALAAWLLLPGPSQGQEQGRPVDAFFADEVWPKIGELTCRNCHTIQGEAAESEFLLRDGDLDPDALRRNREAFAKMAVARTKDGRPRLLQKASGAIKHGGGQALKPGSTGYAILERFVAT